jgi:large subunit ribosomal protein L18
LIEFHEDGDRVLVQANYKDLKKMGWEYSLKDTSASYLVGLMAGIRASKANIPQAVLDIGLHEPSKGNRVFAALKGLLDAGVDIPHGEDIFPDESRLTGENKEAKDHSKAFEKMKNMIMEM